MASTPHSLNYTDKHKAVLKVTAVLTCSVSFIQTAKAALTAYFLGSHVKVL